MLAKKVWICTSFLTNTRGTHGSVRQCAWGLVHGCGQPSFGGADLLHLHEARITCDEAFRAHSSSIQHLVGMAFKGGICV